MKLINLNQISKVFADKYYNGSADDIIYDIMEFNHKLRNPEKMDIDHDPIKAFKAIFSYCGINHVDLNKFIKLKIE